MKSKNIPDIVKRAALHTITDIGQITPQDKRQLNKYIKLGMLTKGKGGPYPRLKIVYAIKGHDFISERKEWIKEVIRISDYEKVNNK